MKKLVFFIVMMLPQFGMSGDFYSPNGNIEVWAEQPDGYFTPAEWAALHPTPTPSPMNLVDAKQLKKNDIDINTNRIRDRDGLTFMGERFAMNDGAMLKWTGLIAAKDMLPFPFTILTIDDKPFQLTSQTVLMQFMAAILGYETAPNSPLSSGRLLRQRVEAATTVEEVMAIVDDRE